MVTLKELDVEGTYDFSRHTVVTPICLGLGIIAD
jgi:hypothetical protein